MQSHVPYLCPMKFSSFPYHRPDMSALQAQFEVALGKFEHAASAENQLTAMQEINAVRSAFDTMYQICSIRHSIDTRDTFYTEEQAYFDEHGPEMEALISKYYQVLVKARFREAIEQKYGKQLFRIAEMQLRAFHPDIIPDLINENKLNTAYQELVASALIPFDGAERTLAEMGPYMKSVDRNVRERAAAARWQFFEDNRAKFDTIFDDLVKTRHRIAKTLGFDNFIAVGYLRMQRSDYNAEMVDVFREQVRKYIVPLATNLRNQQALRLGISTLKYYDEGLQFTSGNATPKGSPEFIIGKGGEMYREMSPETAKFFHEMLDNELMDLVAKKGKAGGGYCTYISGHRAPFIFSNFNGTSADIDVLTHEVGHAFQVFMSRGFDTPEYFWPTSDAAEIHSMSMEYFAYPWMDQFFNGEADKYRYAHLVESLQFLPYGVAVDEFQHRMYAEPELTPLQRKNIWREIEKKYLPHRNYDGNIFLEEGGFWQTQAHIYQSPFYYIDYTLAQMCAFQFWMMAQEDTTKAFNNYVELCKAGGSKSFLELVAYAKLKSPFDPQAFADTIGHIDNYLKGVDDLQLN